MTLLVDAKYFGHTMRSARRALHLKKDHVAKILNITCSQYSDYERGKQLMPDVILQKILTHSFISIHTRHALQCGIWRKQKK